MCLYRLPNPYPLDQEVAVVKQASQVVDETNRNVPISECYVHHYFGWNGLISDKPIPRVTPDCLMFTHALKGLPASGS